MALVIGIDPGKLGGIVPLDKHGDPQRAISMPQVLGAKGGRTGITDWHYVRGLMRAFSSHGNWVVALESLAHVTGGMAGRGKSMGTMIGEFWLLREAIEEVGLPIHEVRSQTWQAAYGLSKNLHVRPAGASDTMSAREKENQRRERRAERERRMVEWADNEWPLARQEFGKDWNLGTIAAAMIGRYEFEQMRSPGNGK